MKHLKKFNEEIGRKAVMPPIHTDETESTNSLICPYCKAEQEVNPMDLFDGDDYASHECEICGETMECSHSVVYVTRKIN